MTADEDKGLVLVVDDYPDGREVMREILSFSGYRVVEAATGPDAMQVALEQLPDVILMDLSLPGLDGDQVTRKLRADPSTAMIPIIVVTAHAMERDRNRALAAGCDSVIVKPCSPTQILDGVGSALSRGRTLASAEGGQP